MIIFDNPAAVPAPAGQYSHLARLDLGHKTMLQLSGQVAIDADGKIVGPDDMFVQADYIMDNITAILIRVDHVDAGHDKRSTQEVARAV